MSRTPDDDLMKRIIGGLACFAVGTVVFKVFSVTTVYAAGSGAMESVPSGRFLSASLWIVSTLVLALVALFLLFRSRARFFFAGMVALGSETSNTALQLWPGFRVWGEYGGGEFGLDSRQTPEVGHWSIHVALLALAALLLYIDHKRRPAAPKD
jgi:hypothetical protein